MKHIFIFINLLLLSINFAYAQNSDYIAIKHIGAQDKPVYPIAIIKSNSDTSKMEEKLRFAPSFVGVKHFSNILDSSSYFFLESIVHKFSEKYGPMEKSNWHPYGNLKVTRYVNDKEVYCFELKTSDESFEFLFTLFVISPLLGDKKFQPDLIEMICMIKPGKIDCQGR